MIRGYPKIPRKTKTSKDERGARRIVAERSSFDGTRMCEISVPPGVHGLPVVLCTVRATDYSHRQSRGVGGKWAASNALDACRACHRWITDHPAVAYEFGWMVRSGIPDCQGVHDGPCGPRCVPVLHAALGLVYLLDDGTTLPAR